MPKIRTKKSLMKKIRISKNGKLMRSNQMRSGHLRRNKSKQALRRHAVPVEMSKATRLRMQRLLGRA